ncbi:MAG TPA: ATP-binding protein [Verrucomicrobiae bacterium]|nr:ATP-binding protein [Verrucomicrobiae bacterium]
MSTRRASAGGRFRQERFASAPEFERGLMANLVAKRCNLLDRPEDKQLIWFLQLLSHQSGGIKKIAADMMEKYPERVATKTMLKYGTKPGKMYSAAQVKVLRDEFGIGSSDLPLYGEVNQDELASHLQLLPDDEKNLAHDMAREDAERHPNGYPLAEFQKHCVSAAQGQLENRLLSLCLDPATPITDGAPWYFPTLVSTLREFQAGWIAARHPEAVTSVGKALCDALEYAAARRRLIIADGLARTGKSYAAKAWCKLNPGSVRYVELTACSDDISFFREIAASLGVSINLNSKAQELRSRIEETLSGGDLMLVIDEAHYLWPQKRHYHSAAPTRINWIMTALVNRGVAVALITTPQFFRSLTAIEMTSHWTSDQFKGRIGRYVKLPDTLSRDELEDLAGVLLPSANADSIRVIARYAESSGKYLGAMEAIADTAKYFCESDGRPEVEFKDVERAVRESVTPSDEALKAALAGATETKRRRVSKAIAAPLQPDFRHDETPLPMESFSSLGTAPARQNKPESAGALLQ